MSHEFFYKTDLLMVLKTQVCFLGWEKCTLSAPSLIRLEQINHAETLHNLCLVSRLFNSVFTEKLYDRLPCKGRKFQLLCDKEKCDLLLQYNKLSHTQTITVDHDSGLKVQDWCQLNSNLAKVIAKSRGNLTTFKSVPSVPVKSSSNTDCNTGAMKSCLLKRAWKLFYPQISCSVFRSHSPTT